MGDVKIANVLYLNIAIASVLYLIVPPTDRLTNQCGQPPFWANSRNGENHTLSLVQRSQRF
ncbi:hypothetical protein J7355_16045 [Endozoicomonas sp. G2_2]|uniref:hypothetical protein n=1 Tax=Endozoicomonas sp. G2_2 TaxID=2821092 RepID=UPI001AD9A528|nr:hypothetical protein [Endozoicomonas sp. G2_2]MBO9471601.1 hypothetical protein [Endozoicomonas sp. G2_2]